MKSLILLVVLAALTVCNNASAPSQKAVYLEDASMYQKDGRFDLDTYYTEVFRTNYRRVGQPGIMEYLDVIYTGNDTFVVTAIALSPQPPFENAFAHVYGDSLLTNQARVIMNSTLGGGFHYLMQVWGYDTQW